MQYLKRKSYLELKKHLDKKEISLILGPRQAGKTTLMFHLRQELKEKKISTFYFNLDIFEDRFYFSTQHKLIDKIKREIGEKGVVFIDEIQRLKNSGLFLKGLYDLGSNYKFIVSGSGSLELKSNVLEPLTGRKKVIYCYPLSFEEFCVNKLNVDFFKVNEYLNNEPFLKERLMEEYFNFGGYPKVFFLEKNEDKKEALKEIYQSYLEKDIKILLGVEKDYVFDNLVKILASSIGNLVNINEISINLGVNIKTIKKYLYFLEKTFIIQLIPPFFTNVRVEIKKMPKVYFLDLGLLNLVRGGVKGGSFFENACFLRIKEKYPEEKIYFWRTKNAAEVDFVLGWGKEIVAYEIKETIKGKTLGKSLISFIKKYRPKKVFLMGKNVEKQAFKFEGTVIEIVEF